MTGDATPLFILVGLGLLIGIPLLLAGVGDALQVFAQGYLAKHSKRSGE
jgi:hypothetical protein